MAPESGRTPFAEASLNREREEAVFQFLARTSNNELEPRQEDRALPSAALTNHTRGMPVALDVAGHLNLRVHAKASQ